MSNKIENNLPNLFNLHKEMDRYATLATYLPSDLKDKLKKCSEDLREVIDTTISQK